ncbi:hypothetical protein [Spiroplasma turonicum]|uniref:Transmembrane protein n=1 Tax=Spiroplasma turonicum TaxID=216946 RepID=A0A0K1P711_9MOLU|nr:hypothetical protein [Spiroplasma turonicum]AKU80101.1 hypothetical protein STURON_00855 [Spiroplasma turonicum]
MSTISPSPKSLESRNFDNSITNQIIYLSVWICIDNFVFGLLNLIHLKYKNMPTWITNKSNFTRIVSLNVISFILYLGGLSSKEVPGFDTWYNIIKSILEHFVTPVIIIIFYFILKREIVTSKVYIKKYSWNNFILITLYILFALTRSILLIKYDPINALHPYPYKQMDPRIIGNFLFYTGIVSLILVCWLMGVFINYLSNLTIKNDFKISRRKNKFQ